MYGWTRTYAIHVLRIDSYLCVSDLEVMICMLLLIAKAGMAGRWLVGPSEHIVTGIIETTELVAPVKSEKFLQQTGKKKAASRFPHGEAQETLQ
jgi:hypothetical protein